MIVSILAGMFGGVLVITALAAFTVVMAWWSDRHL